MNMVKTKNPPLGSVAVKTLRTWQVSFQWSRRRKAWLELNKQSSGISSSRKLCRYPRLPLLPPPDTQGGHTPHTLIYIYIPSTHSIPTHFTHTHTGEWLVPLGSNCAGLFLHVTICQLKRETVSYSSIR